MLASRSPGLGCLPSGPSPLVSSATSARQPSRPGVVPSPGLHARRCVVSDPPSCRKPRSSTTANASFGGEPEERMRLRFSPSERVWFDRADDELCMLPFPSDEILVPGMEKVLHLYEARYIRLLEEAMERKDNLFVHTVVVTPWDPSQPPELLPGAFMGQDFALCCNTLVQIEKVEAGDVGAWVQVRGQARVGIKHLTSTHPYISGVVSSLGDDIPENPSSVIGKRDELEGVMKDIVRLGKRLNGNDEYTAELEQIQDALQWSASPSEVMLSCSPDPEVELASRLSFAALHDVPAASEMNMMRMVQARVEAMSTMDTEERLDAAIAVMTEMKSTLVAKVALNSLEI